MSNNAKEEMTETNPTANTADEKEGNRVKGHKSFVLSGVPLSVLRRVRALKKLQMAEIDLDCKFHDRINQLEKEFKPHFDELNQKVGRPPRVASVSSADPLSNFIHRPL
jgi:hypothetical protein